MSMLPEKYIFHFICQNARLAAHHAFRLPENQNKVVKPKSSID